MIANEVLLKCLGGRESIAVLASEEDEEPLILRSDSDGGKYCVLFDPLDGSTNASRPLPWFATSICVVDGAQPRAAVVHDHASGVRWDVITGGGARVDGALLPRRAPVPLNEAIVAINALPSRNPGWGQFRCFGAAALDLCAVADGRFDAENLTRSLRLRLGT